YIVQRAEVLMALFYLTALLCFLKGLRSSRPGIWFTAAALICLVGQGAKEVMVTAPLTLLLVDVAGITGSWRASWRARKWWHVLNFGALVVCASLIAAQGGRSGTVGWEGADGLKYLAAQATYLLTYLKLCFW